MACANHWFEESSRVWGVPPPHENNWLSRPDRQALWGAGDNAQLEHNTLSATNPEIRRARQVDRLSWNLDRQAGLSLFSVWRRRVRVGLRIGGRALWLEGSGGEIAWVGERR